MFEYKIRLNFKITDCASCPFRHEVIVNEPVESLDKLTGITSITRRASHCMVKQEPIFINENVEGYNSKCPLKGNTIYLNEDSSKI